MRPLLFITHLINGKTEFSNISDLSRVKEPMSGKANSPKQANTVSQYNKELNCSHKYRQEMAFHSFILLTLFSIASRD